MLRKILKSFWLWAVVLLVIFRFLVLFLALNGIPAIGVVKEDWLFQAGSDARSYFQTAKDLFGAEEFKINPLGLPLLLAIFIKILGAGNINDLAKPMVVLYTVVLYTLSTLLVYWLAKRILRKKIWAFVVAGFFNIYPYLFYYFIHFLGSGSSVVQHANQVIFMWLSFLGLLSEPLSAFLMLLALFLVFKIIGAKRENFAVALLLGLVGGWACITRFQNFVIVPFYIFIFTVLQKFKSALFFVLGVAPFILLQIFFDYLARGSVFNAGYNFSKSGDVKEGMVVSFSYLFRIVKYPLENCPWLFIPMAIGGTLLVLGIYWAIKQDKKTGLILAGYFFANTIPLLFFEAALRNPRYFLPVLPVAFIFIVAGFLQAVSFFKKKYEVNSNYAKG